MNNYYAIHIGDAPLPQDSADLIAAFLADEGFESFVEDPCGMIAYIKEELYNPKTVNAILADLPIPGEYPVIATLIEGEDWNKEWERNYFKPILIEDRVVIRSSFHNDAPSAEIEILIDPKMAFGTGHHATTSMMVTHLLHSDLQGKSVIDMGTGTGILAILATKLGASRATGIEIDRMAFENTIENGQLNHSDAHFICGDASSLETIEPADIFLANINRNVILADIKAYASKIKPGGALYLSGFYPIDIPMIAEATAPLGLSISGQTTLGDWASLCLIKG